MIKAKKKSKKVSADQPRLINILAELCQCDAADIEWDASGSSDIIGFKSGSRRYLLKLAQESSGGYSDSFADFRVRVLIS